MTASTAITSLRQDPLALDLATLLSPAVLVTPELLRRLRLLLPGADVGTEVAVWMSEAMTSRSPLDASFDHEVAEHLRTRLRNDPRSALRDMALAIIRADHASYHWSLRVEVELNLIDAQGIAGDEVAEQLVFATIDRLSTMSNIEARPIARWLLAALGRIPSSIRATEAAHTASFGAGLLLDGRLPTHSDGLAAAEPWLPGLLRDVGTVNVAVEQYEGAVELRLAPGGNQDIDVVTAPSTKPVVITVSWQDGPATKQQVVHLRHPDSSAVVPVASSRVMLSTLAGRRWEVRHSGPELSQVVAVVAVVSNGRFQVASGYLITGRLVLTAEHCTRDTTQQASVAELQVFRASDGAQALGVTVAAKSPGTGDTTGIDLAVLRLESAPWDEDVPLPIYARVDRSQSGVLKDCQAVGYPMFQGAGVRDRVAAELHGTIYQTELAPSGGLVVREPLLTTVRTPADAEDSAWGGLSGAVVFHHGRALGVVIEHHPRQGASAVQLAAFDQLQDSIHVVERCCHGGCFVGSGPRYRVADRSGPTDDPDRGSGRPRR